MKAAIDACFLLVASLCAVIILGSHPLPCAGDEPAGAEQTLDELIAQLGDASFAVREAAAKQLMERQDAVPALRRALKSRDSEVARRAQEVLDALDRREKERAFAKLTDLVKHGAVDQAVEKFARREKWEDETACWQLFAELAGKLTDRERELYGKASLPDSDPGIPARDFRRYAADMGRHFEIVAARRPSREQMKRSRAIRAEEIVGELELMRNLIISSGDVKVNHVLKSVIFAGGSVSFYTAKQALVVCDGDIDVAHLTDCLIIARGTVRCKSSIGNSRIVSRGAIQGPPPAAVEGSNLVEKEAKPLDVVTFFDPAKVGLTVESADGGVRVKGAEQGKPFAAAGLRADDLITALDGDAVKDADSFRRLLRAKLAVEGITTVKGRRGDKALEIPVAHKD